MDISIDGSPPLDEAVRKARIKAKHMLYSFCLSFRSGATEAEITRGMKTTLGAVVDYAGCGYASLKHLLFDHESMGQRDDGSWYCISKEEVKDLEALISKQKTNKKGASKSGKKRRPISQAFHRPSMFSSPKFRSISSMTTRITSPKMRPLVPPPAAPKAQPSISVDQVSSTTSVRRRPVSAASLSSTSNSRVFRKPPPGSRPTTKTALGSPSENNAHHIKAPETKECRYPSIKEFNENVKSLFVNYYPNSINLNDISRKYALEFDQEFDPADLFSRSWLTLVRTLFKDFLEMDNAQNVKLRDSVAANNPNIKAKSTFSPPPRWTPSLTPTSMMCEQMESLSINKAMNNTFPAREPPKEYNFAESSPVPAPPFVRKVTSSRTPDGRQSLRIKSMERGDYADISSTESVVSVRNGFEYSKDVLIECKSTRIDPLVTFKVSSAVNKSPKLCRRDGQKPLLPIVKPIVKQDEPIVTTQKPLRPTTTTPSSERRPQTAVGLPTARIATAALSALARQERCMPVARRIVESSPSKMPSERPKIQLPPRASSSGRTLVLPPVARPRSSLYLVSPKNREEKQVTLIEEPSDPPKRRELILPPKAVRRPPLKTVVLPQPKTTVISSCRTKLDYVEVSQAYPLGDTDDSF